MIARSIQDVAEAEGLLHEAVLEDVIAPWPSGSTRKQQRCAALRRKNPGHGKICALGLYDVAEDQRLIGERCEKWSEPGIKRLVRIHLLYAFQVQNDDVLTGRYFIHRLV